ncbi:MAG TPA: hypothetical protein VIJ39_13790 [Solirubrobacteraceae bacterium]
MRVTRLAGCIWIVGALAFATTAFSAPAALGAFGVTEGHFEAGTCNEASCTYSSPHGAFYTQAAGHPPFGITAFEFNSESKGLGSEPVGNVKNIRVDVPPGLAANPEALPKCSVVKFEKDECEAPEQVGTDELTVFVLGANVPVTGAVYNLEQPEGIPLEFGIHVSLAAPLVVNEHIFLVGHLSWSTDYHEYFEINNVSKTIPILKSKLIFDGTAGTGFLTIPSECSSTTTSHLRVESYTGEVSETSTHTPVGVEGCGNVPFKPSISVTPGDSQSDRPDGALVKAMVPQSVSSTEANSSDLRNAVVTLPEGMTLNPPAANGLTACTNTQIGIKTTNPVECPPTSKIGTVTIQTPDLPAGSLSGNVYLGQPLSSEPASGEEYRIFIDAESAHGVSVRLEGHISANPSTGRLTTTFSENPQLPFSELILAFDGGLQAPLANPLMCGPATTNASFTPYSGDAAAESLMTFPIDFNGKGGACPSPLPFALTQTASTKPTTGGAGTSLTYGLDRGEGQQYLSKLTTILPPGLVGKIPSVTLCGEPQAANGTCTSASQIGTVTVSLGSGSPLLTLGGTAYLTSAYGGAPYGLSVVVPAEKVGPYDFGKIVTRATINVEPFTARIVISSQLPTIVGGVPLRLRTLSVNANRSNFAINPTNCGALTTTTTLTSTFGTTQSLSTPFQATGCSALAFSPKFTASTNAKTSKANGAILVVKVAYPAGAQANIKSVLVTLPKQLPARTSTLNNACPEATFNANPLGCPPLSKVGTATVTTPVLPGKLTGPAIYVSHGGAAFPDLDLVLKGDDVTVILIGNTNISKGITTSNYAAVPDVPISTFEVRLPTGRDSVLGAVGNLCKPSSLLMPTVITAQNGKVIKQSTHIAVGSCPITVLSHRVRGHTAIITAKVPAAGRVSGGGKKLSTRYKHPGKAKTVTIDVPLSNAGVKALAAHHKRLSLRVKLGFVPKAKKSPKSSASVTVVFR